MTTQIYYNAKLYHLVVQLTKSLTQSLKTFFGWCLSIAISDDSFDSSKSTIVSVAVICIWLAIVIFTATMHEFWRDEVRALSLARSAVSLLDLYEQTKYDGHPILWFLLLYIGDSIVDSQLILPIISISVAFVAVVIFTFFSPFPLWIRFLFIFSVLPLYEYSVMARNYGISMLLMFISAAIYRHRNKYPLLLAVVLALLANTNVHSAIIVCLIASLWIWDTIVEQRTAYVSGKLFSLCWSLIIIFAGVLLCVVFTFPRENTILTSVNDISWIDIYSSFSEAILKPGYIFSSILPNDIPLWSDAILRPSHIFSSILPNEFIFWLVSLLLYLAVFGLINRPNLFLAGLAGMIGFGLFFDMVYGGSYRHQGVFFIFLLFLYWIFIDSVENVKTIATAKKMLFYAGFYVAILILILGSVNKTKVIWNDINQEMSSSKSFGEFLNSSKKYNDAIIVPEPDYLLESLPYYAKNLIYFPREHRFGTTVSWTTDANYRLSLGELLAIARDINIRYDQPVLIVIGHRDLHKYDNQKKKYSYNKEFAWKNEDVTDFIRLTSFVTEFTSASGDENYSVYAVK